MMEKTTINLHTKFMVAPVDPRLFGGFLEHMGRAVYEGVYDPENPSADEDGFRKDVLDTLRRLDMTVLRYPGGNFASGYHWQDGIGPREARPTVRELAWQSREPNRFGTEEFLGLSRKMGWQPMLTVNLGTGSPEEARNWVEYCNCPAGTRYADLRVSNGSPSPHAVPLWCLGNEMDGPWQLGHVPADQYALRARQAAKMMKDADRSIELVAGGSCGTGLSTYMEWDRQVLDTLGDLADYISLHRYVGNPEDDTPDYLAVTNSIDRQIEEMDAACRFAQAKNRSRKRAYLCFDEWNVWYRNMQMDGEGKFAPHLIEEVYNLEDALVVAGFLHSFVRHADVVRIANLAQIVNVIAPLLTRENGLLIQSIFYPFGMFSRRRKGISLRCSVEGPTYEGAKNGLVHTLDASAILDGDRLHVFLTNRSLDESAETDILLADRPIVSPESAELLTGPDPKAANSFENAEAVIARPFQDVKVAAGQAHCKLPPLSFAALTLNLQGSA
ncbi:MAG TPA: alpha-L-arabinofuranosidase C-terminal domain-containing protein [Anaerolineales bacterium]|nr:alpha-L-arabinofuranosidase C-terminal domain-containing protein [Anaerolineales bacterium]